MENFFKSLLKWQRDPNDCFENFPSYKFNDWKPWLTHTQKSFQDYFMDILNYIIYTYLYFNSKLLLAGMLIYALEIFFWNKTITFAFNFLLFFNKIGQFFYLIVKYLQDFYLYLTVFVYI